MLELLVVAILLFPVWQRFIRHIRRFTAFFPSSSFSDSFDKGAEGESVIYSQLERFEKLGGKILSNIYIAKINGGRTEIDLILIHQKGVFVFESKNYSGWIFGNENHRNWTQTLPKGWQGHVHKERFYNPILQNASHIKHLAPHIKKKIPIWSIIVFSDECELKDIIVTSKNVRVIQCRDVAYTVTEICNNIQSNSLTETDIETLYNQIVVYSSVSQEDKEFHAQKVFEAKQRF